MTGKSSWGEKKDPPSEESPCGLSVRKFLPEPIPAQPEITRDKKADVTNRLRIKTFLALNASADYSDLRPIHLRAEILAGKCFRYLTGLLSTQEYSRKAEETLDGLF
jgi:hypothetical protein